MVIELVLKFVINDECSKCMRSDIQSILMSDMHSCSREKVRSAVYRHFMAHGRAPSAAVLADTLGCGTGDVEIALAGLAESRDLVLRTGDGSIWMAHPFSGVASPYEVRARGTSYWANCAWDALGIAAVLGEDTEAAARCPDCDAEVNLSVRSGAVVDAIAVIHFVVSPSEFWCNIGFT